MLMAITVALIFFSCEKETFAPESEQDAMEESALKGAKINVKRTFEGVCTKVWAIQDQNEWYDATDDWRTTGTTIWKMDGTAVLIVEAKNPHEENRGKWEMEYVFVEFSSTPEGTYILCTVTGTGTEGKVKGMKANWIYTMDCDGPAGPSNPEFFYAITGNIDNPQGPIKKGD